MATDETLTPSFSPQCVKTQALLGTPRLHVLAAGRPTRSREEDVCFPLCGTLGLWRSPCCGGAKSCSLVSPTTLAQFQAPHVSEDASPCHDFSPQKFSLGSLVSSLHLFSISWGCWDLSTWIQGLVLAHTILISRTCPATLSPSIYIYVSYCRISEVKYNVRDTLPCWYCLLGFINLSSRISMVIGELTGIVNSLVWAARKRNSPIRWT